MGQSVVALVTAAFTYKAWIADYLPKSATPSSLDKYVLGCMAIIVSTAVQTSLLHACKTYMPLCNDIAAALPSEDSVAVAFMVIWLSYNIYTVLRTQPGQ